LRTLRAAQVKVESIEHQIFHLVTPGGLPRGLPTDLSGRLLRPRIDLRSHD